MSRSALSVAGILAGLTSTAMRTAFGTNSCRSELVQKCQPLRSQLIREKIDPRKVSVRPGETGNQTKLDRVFADAEDDWDRRGRSFGRERSRLPAGVAMTATRRRTRSAMSTGRRSNWPSSQWYSTVTFWLST